jgi:iron complex transport system substrate-binding protein
MGEPAAGHRLKEQLRERIAHVQRRTAGLTTRPRVAVIEWLDPVFCSGHWTPELVEIAGGTEPLGRRGEPAARVPWQAVVDAAPDVLVLACCGFDVARTVSDVPRLTVLPGWNAIPAVCTGAVYAVDGSAYLSRPGPRLVDSIELLAEMLHPDRFTRRLPHSAWRRVELPTT